MLGVELFHLLIFTFCFIFIGIAWHYFIRKIPAKEIPYICDLIEAWSKQHQAQVLKKGISLHQLRRLKKQSKRTLDAKVAFLTRKEAEFKHAESKLEE